MSEKTNPWYDHLMIKHKMITTCCCLWFKFQLIVAQLWIVNAGTFNFLFIILLGIIFLDFKKNVFPFLTCCRTQSCREMNVKHVNNIFIREISKQPLMHWCCPGCTNVKIDQLHKEDGRIHKGFNEMNQASNRARLNPEGFNNWAFSNQRKTQQFLLNNEKYPTQWGVTHIYRMGRDVPS